jgi:hypothetical protein
MKTVKISLASSGKHPETTACAPHDLAVLTEPLEPKICPGIGDLHGYLFQLHPGNWLTTVQVQLRKRL